MDMKYSTQVKFLNGDTGGLGTITLTEKMSVGMVKFIYYSTK